jgi:hypothetical protein
VLVSLVYDLLEYVSKIGLFLLNRTPMLHVVTHFFSTGINLFITIVVIQQILLVCCHVLPLSLFKCSHNIHAGQNFLNLIRFVENISNIYIFK